MEVIGKVIEKLPLRTGTSARGDWKISQLVVEFADGQYTNTVCLQNSKDANGFESIPLGQQGKFYFSVSSRKGQQGGWFTSCNCYKWELSQTSATYEPVQDDLPV